MKNAKQCLAMAAKAIACGDTKTAADYLAKAGEFQDDLTSFYDEVFKAPTETGLHGNSPSGNTLAPSLYSHSSSGSEFKSIVDDVAREFAVASFSEDEEEHVEAPELTHYLYSDDKELDFELEMGVASSVSSGPVRYKRT